MDTQILVEGLPLLGTCILCLNEGAVKSMITFEENNEDQELYSEMLHKCFSIDILSMDLGDSKALICLACTGHLRDAYNFKKQALDSLHTLETNAKLNKGLEELKSESNFSHFEDPPCDADDDDDNTVISQLKIKKEEETQDDVIKPEKKKSKIKTKLKNRRSKSDIEETIAMMSQGLFPFKITVNKRFSCAICSEKYKELDGLKDHTLQHHKKHIHEAFQNSMFSNPQRFYKVSTSLRCKLCTSDVNDYQQLSDHIQNCVRLKIKYVHHKDNVLPFKLEKDQLDCPICKKTFLNFVNLNTHMNVHYPNFVCENCGKAFASKARLRGHVRTHEIGEFPCKYCNQVFDRVTKRENHVSKEHKSGVRYACKRCNISLTSFYARQKHLAEVHNEELKRYKCKACPQSYITPGHLSSHVRRDHLNERNHKCTQCDQAFYTRNALQMHMIKHDGERIHTCNICQKSYQRKKTLREHMRIHDNDKRFVCPVCSRAFTQKCTLKGHLKVHDRSMEPIKVLGDRFSV